MQQVFHNYRTKQLACQDKTSSLLYGLQKKSKVAHPSLRMLGRQPATCVASCSLISPPRLKIPGSGARLLLNSLKKNDCSSHLSMNWSRGGPQEKKRAWIAAFLDELDKNPALFADARAFVAEVVHASDAN